MQKTYFVSLICFACFCSFLISVLTIPEVKAHPLSSTYVDITVNKNKIQSEVNIPLPWVLTVDINKPPSEIKALLAPHREEITSYILKNLYFKNGKEKCQEFAQAADLSYYPDGPYFTLSINLECGIVPEKLEIEYNLYFDKESTHPAFLSIKDNGNEKQIYILTKEQPNQTINLKTIHLWQQLQDFIKLGIHHIFLGYDHLLFILLLILPIVLQVPFSRKLITIISSFTIAHSLTLTLAALEIIKLPPRLTESCIALSVVAAALINIISPKQKDRWIIAFSFGLIHGFGFANVLADYGLSTKRLIQGLVGFNIGVEIGQLLIACSIIPVLYWLSKYKAYQRFIIPSISFVAGTVAFLWFIERAFNIPLIS